MKICLAHRPKKCILILGYASLLIEKFHGHTQLKRVMKIFFAFQTNAFTLSLNYVATFHIFPRTSVT